MIPCDCQHRLRSIRAEYPARIRDHLESNFSRAAVRSCNWLCKPRVLTSWVPCVRSVLYPRNRLSSTRYVHQHLKQKGKTVSWECCRCDAWRKKASRWVFGGSRRSFGRSWFEQRRSVGDDKAWHARDEFAARSNRRKDTIYRSLRPS